MRLLIVLAIFHLLVINASAYNDNPLIRIFPPDTVPPPPPGSPGTLTGPSWVCTGETAVYKTDVPVACSCQWTVNGAIQAENGSTLTMTWTEQGTNVISVIYVCSGGASSDPQTTTTDVFGTPQPSPISGDESVCEYTFHTYSTTVGPGDSCQWTVNDVIMPGYSSSITYSFGASGNYQFEVIAFNPCGTSLPQTLDVTAQGTAPAPPGPVQGPGESCTGNTDLYTTTVGPGESCEWRIDGVLQASTTTTLEVTWDVWGDRAIEARAVGDCGTGNPAIKEVIVRYMPEVFLGNDTTLLQGQTLTLDAGNPGSEYLWSTGETTQTIDVNTSGNYSVNVANFCGADSDEIEVSFYVGINEAASADHCFSLMVSGRKLIIGDLHADIEKVQVFSLTGTLIYEGKNPDDICLPGQGIYLVRVISTKISCYRKLFIP